MLVNLQLSDDCEIHIAHQELSYGVQDNWAPQSWLFFVRPCWFRTKAQLIDRGICVYMLCIALFVSEWEGVKNIHIQ